MLYLHCDVVDLSVPLDVHATIAPSGSQLAASLPGEAITNLKGGMVIWISQNQLKTTTGL